MPLRFCVILAVFIARASFAQVLEFVRPSGSDIKLLSVREVQNLERMLGYAFPTRSLRHSVLGKKDPLTKRITYEVLKQRGQRYVIAVFTGLWKNEASQLTIMKIEGGGYPTPLFYSRSWRSNYSDSYHEIQVMPQGRENIILLKEGGMGKGSFVLASLFSFRSKRSSDDAKSIVILNDITPRLPHLKAIVDFPFRPLYGQAIKLQRQPEQLLLQAADVEFSWDKSLAPKALEFWKYDRPSRKFVPANNVSAIPVMTIQ